MKKTYETERLILKVLDKSHAELVIDYYLRNKSFLEEWEPVKSEEFYTKQYQEEQLRNELSNIENKRSFRLWIFKREDSGRIIGSVGFNNNSFVFDKKALSIDRKKKITDILISVINFIILLCLSLVQYLLYTSQLHYLWLLHYPVFPPCLNPDIHLLG